jgi:hypothetical protein
MRESKIREELAEVLQGELPLEDFAYWLRRRRNDIYRRGTPAAQALAASIALMLYEHDDGYRNDEELRRGLGLLLSTYRMALRSAAGHIIPSAPRYADLLTSSADRVLRYVVGAADVRPVEPLTSLSGMLVSA